MTPFGDADPAKTFAVVVGVERYPQSPGLDLNGPALDALRFARWLRDKHVPANQIYPFVSALDDNADEVANGLAELELVAEEPAIGPIRRVFSETLKGKAGDLLIVVWGGHGVLSDRGSDRRLILSDASADDPRNVRFDSVLEALRTTSYAGLKRQLYIIDACANYFESLRWKTDMPGESIPAANAMTQECLQFVLYAAASGQQANNAGTRRTGDFSETVLEWLNAPDRAFPGDIADLNQHVKRHFDERNATAAGRQTPVHYVWDGRYPGGADEHLGAIPRERTFQAGARAANLSIEQLRIIGDGLAGLPSMLDRATRDRLVARLGGGVRTDIVQRSDDPPFDLLNIAAAAIATGATQALFEAVALAEPNAIAAERERERANRIVFAMTAFAALADAPVTPARYYQLYLRAASSAQTAGGVAQALDALLTRLADMAPNADGVRPLAEFMLCVAAESPDDAPVSAWLQAHVPAAERAAAKALVERKRADEGRVRPYLAFLVRTVGLKAGEAPGVEAWLWRGDDVETRHWVKACAADDAAVRAEFLSILDEARDICGSALVVEFLVPREQFALAPEAWELTAETFGPPSTVGDEHFVALRWRERYTEPKAAQATNWVNRMGAIEKRRAARLAASALWVSPAQYDYRTLRAELMQNVDNADVVGLAFVPPELPDRQAGDLVVAALLAGAPFMCIPREDRARWDDLRDELRDSLSCGIDVFPHTVTQLRARPGTLLGTCTALLWDRPDHVPRRDGRLSQPPTTT